MFNIFLVLIILFIMIAWFIRLAGQMGLQLQGKFTKTLCSSKEHYQGEKVNKKEIFAVFGMAVLFRILIYLCSVLYMYMQSTEATFSFQNLLSSWNRWDSTHYLNLAELGYSGYVENDQHLFLVFFPLYPWMIKLFHVFVSDWQLAAILVSVIAYAVGSCFFYTTVAGEYNKSVAAKTLVLLSVFPFGFFFGSIMTESLFFCTMAAGYYFIKKHNWLAVGIVGMLCALCRMHGLILLGVAGVELLVTYPFFTYLREKKIGEFMKMIFTKAIFLLLIPIGDLIYLYINYSVEGDFFRFKFYQKDHWGLSPTFFTNTIQEICYNLFGEHSSPEMKMCIWLPEIVLFFLAIALLYYGVRRHPLKYTAYLFVYTIFNFSVTWLISGGRYMLCALPLFIIGGEFCHRHPKVFPIVVSVSSVLMAIYMIGYFNWQPVM